MRSVKCREKRRSDGEIISAAGSSFRSRSIWCKRQNFLGAASWLRIQSEDTSHGFRLVGTNLSAVVPKRGKGEVSLRVRLDQPGRMTFECTRVCGAGHNFMRGLIVVRAAATGATR